MTNILNLTQEDQTVLTVTHAKGNQKLCGVQIDFQLHNRMHDVHCHRPSRLKITVYLLSPVNSIYYRPLFTREEINIIFRTNWVWNLKNTPNLEN